MAMMLHHIAGIVHHCGNFSRHVRRILTHLEWMHTWWEETGPKVDSNSISLVRFGVRQLPVTLVERSIPGRIAATMAEWMDNTTELDDGTVTSVNFTQLWLDSL